MMLQEVTRRGGSCINTRMTRHDEQGNQDGCDHGLVEIDATDDFPLMSFQLDMLSPQTSQVTKMIKIPTTHGGSTLPTPGQPREKE